MDLQPPHHELGGVTLNGADDVTGLGSRMGIDTDYENVRSTFEKLLSQAGNYFFELAGQLNAIAAFYERQEQTTASGFKKLEPGGSR